MAQPRLSVALPITWSPGPHDRLTVTTRAADPAARGEPVLAGRQAVRTTVARFADVGGACGPTAYRSQASMAVVDATSSDPDELRCEFEIKGLSAFAARALASALEFFSRRVLPLTRTSIYADASMQPPAWPTVSRFVGPLPFSVRDDRVHFTSGFDIDIRLASPPFAEAATIVEDAFGHWVSAVNIGCFATRGLPADQCHAYPGDETVVDGNLLRLSLDEASFAEPEAVESLLGIFQCVHERGTPIEHVEIYE